MRIGIIGIAIYDSFAINDVNQIISDNNEIVLGRMGLPIQENKMKVISLIVHGDTDVIGKLSGRIGNLKGVEIKSMLLKEIS